MRRTGFRFFSVFAILKHLEEFFAFKTGKTRNLFKFSLKLFTKAEKSVKIHTRLTNKGDLRMKKTLLLMTAILLVAATLMSFSIPISAVNTYSGKIGDNLTWSLNTATGELVISGEGDMIDSDSAWRNYTEHIRSVVIENGVKSIGAYAFYECTNLTSIIIPDSVTSIGDSAFSFCERLTDVTIPNSVTSIGIYAFSMCADLSNIIVSEGNTAYKSIDGNLYSKDGQKLIHYAIGKTDKSFTIPDGVTSIEDFAFVDCQSLTSITIPGSVKDIGNYTFYCNENLTDVTICDGVTSINGATFSECYALTNITIPNSVTSIGYEAFKGCSSLTNIKIPDSVTSIEDFAFEYCSGLTSITIPDSVTNLGAAFYECTGLKSIEIPNSVTRIDNATFCRCESLTNVTIPNSVTSIGLSAFEWCRSLTSVTIPDSVTSIGNEAFRGCSSLTSITIPDSVTSIGYRVFDECDSLKYNVYDNVRYLGNSQNPYVALIEVQDKTVSSCSLPDSVVCIAGYAFIDCTALASVTINNVKNISMHAFYNCIALTSVTMGDGVESISMHAFSNCIALTSVTIGNGVTSIAQSAFDGCYNLEYNIYDNVRYLGNSQNPYVALIEVKDKTKNSYSIPNGVVCIAGYAFYSSRKLTSIAIPDSVRGIGVGAFLDCIGLTDITVSEGNTNYKTVDGNLYSKDGKRLLQYIVAKTDTAFTIPDSVEVVGFGAFCGCTSLTSITIPNSVTTVELGAFWGCKGLTNIVLPDSITYIDQEVFCNCSNLDTVTYRGTEEMWDRVEKHEEWDYGVDFTLVFEHVHDWGEGVVTTPATHTATGVKTFTCACGETITEEIPVLTDTPNTDPAQTSGTQTDVTDGSENNDTQAQTQAGSGGCGSFVAIGGMATVALSLVGVAFVGRKKRNN